MFFAGNPYIISRKKAVHEKIEMVRAIEEGFLRVTTVLLVKEGYL